MRLKSRQHIESILFLERARKIFKNDVARTERPHLNRNLISLSEFEENPIVKFLHTYVYCI